MKQSNSDYTILCVWELGGDLGHITRLSRVTKALEDEGYRVVLALKDLSRCYPFFKETRAQILQAPVWLLKMKMQRSIACQADALLLSGYLDADALLMLAKAWKEIAQLVQPDVIIFDYSPTAQLALRDEIGVKKIIIGTGFSEPEAGYPIVDWRYPKVGDNLVTEQERVVLHPINLVLKKLNKSTIETLSELWRVDKVILNEFPPFDPYNEVRKNTIYCLAQDFTNDLPVVVFPETGKKRVLAYLKPSYPKFEQILKALADADADVFVVSPLAPDHILQSYENEHFKYSKTPVNLAEGLKRADLFVGHGNATSVKEALIAEIPTIVLPQQQEQLLIGKTLQELGAGRVVLGFQSSKELSDLINKALNDQEMHDRVNGMARSFKGRDQTVASVAKECIAELLSK